MTENNMRCLKCNNPFFSDRKLNAKYATNRPRCTKLKRGSKTQCGSREIEEI